MFAMLLGIEEKNFPVRNKSASPSRRSKPKEALIGLVLLFVVLGLACYPLAKGALFYQSYWGGAVFVPFVLVIAVIIVVAIVVNGRRR